MRIIIFLTLFWCASLAHSQTRAPLDSEKKVWLSKATRHEKNGWTYLHIEGAPRERGFQHGYLMTKEINEAIRMLSASWNYQTAMDWRWLIRKAAEMLTPKIDSENLAEIDGIAEGMKANGAETSRDELVALNGYIELISYWWPSVKDSMRSHSIIRPRLSVIAS